MRNPDVGHIISIQCYFVLTAQFLVNNRQLYKLERSSAISRCMLPGSVDLDVNTYLTISPEVSPVFPENHLYIYN